MHFCKNRVAINEDLQIRLSVSIMTNQLEVIWLRMKTQEVIYVSRRKVSDEGGFV